jgi:hypothetical protein
VSLLAILDTVEKKTAFFCRESNSHFPTAHQYVENLRKSFGKSMFIHFIFYSSVFIC